MPTIQLPTALPEDARLWVDEIAALIAASSAEERLRLCDTIDTALVLLAAAGQDDVILTAQLLRRLALIATTVTRDEIRDLEQKQREQREAGEG